MSTPWASKRRRRFTVGGTAAQMAHHEITCCGTVGPVAISHSVESKGRFLLPATNVKEAVAELERSEADALAVVDSVSDLRVLGVLTEAHALRRYSEELDQRHREARIVRTGIRNGKLSISELP